MKASKYLLLLSTLFLFSLKPIDETPKNVIQTKLEAKNLKELVILGEKLQSVDTLSKFYQNHSFELAWNEKSASQLIFAIQQAKNEGLNSEDYHIKRLVQLVLEKPTTATEIAEHDILLTDALLLYANHLMRGKVKPKLVDPECYYPVKKHITIHFLDSILGNNKVNELIQLTAPRNPLYANLKKTLSKYRKLKTKEWTVIAEGITIKKDMEDDRIPTIREHLKVLGDLKITDTLNAALYDSTLLVSVKQFQERHGLEIDGNIGSNTIKMLNLSIEERIAIICANMERLRWLPNDLGKYYVQVNIANFELKVIKNDTLQRTHKVIVGQPKRSTPLLSSTMEYVVLNPTWTVPPGIRNKDVIPGIRKNANYLQKKDLEVIDRSGNVINPTTIDWNSSAAYNYIFRQPSGPSNALGAVKFLFPNNLFIYIHDTPSKYLFNKTQRAHSSGCIRVENPLDLAEYLLDDTLNWNQTKINEVVATEKLQTICLIDQPHVYLIYNTAWTDTNNITQFREDIYGLDEVLLGQMNKISN